MDTLSVLLQDLRLEGSYYARSELQAPWGIAFLKEDGPCFHIVLSGRCWLHKDTEQILLEAGDLVILPQGIDHHLSNPLENSATLLNALPSKRIGECASLLTFGGEGEAALLICGGIQFAEPTLHPFLELLPTTLVLHTRQKHTEEKEFAWLEATLTILGYEALALRPGYDAIMTRLADVLVMQTIRAWLEQNTNLQSSWLAALEDQRIGRVLVIIHQRAEEAWTVTSLASEVAMSRSSFSERFSQLVGMSPMKYLTRWRMFVASKWILDEHISLSEAAHRLGYSSEAAFSRAFKQCYHMPPGIFQTQIGQTLSAHSTRSVAPKGYDHT